MHERLLKPEVKVKSQSTLHWNFALVGFPGCIPNSWQLSHDFPSHGAISLDSGKPRNKSQALGAVGQVAGECSPGSRRVDIEAQARRGKMIELDAAIGWDGDALAVQRAGLWGVWGRGLRRGNGARRRLTDGHFDGARICVGGASGGESGARGYVGGDNDLIAANNADSVVNADRGSVFHRPTQRHALSRRDAVGAGRKTFDSCLRRRRRRGDSDSYRLSY